VNPNPPDQHGDERAQAGADSLGEQLRRAREARNLTLRELSDQTRISRRHLEAIEANDFKQLPGGIFNRSFIKSFARAVRFNEDEAVRAYQRVARERGETFDDVPTTRQASRIYMDDVPTRSPALTAALSLVILVIISLGVYAGLHYYRRSERPNATAQNNSPRQNAQPAQTTSQPANAATVANAPATAGLKIVVRAKGEDVWLRSTVDAQPPSDVTLKPEQTREINADQTLKLEYARVKASALEVTINGRPATVPSETKPGKLVEMLISKDDYERLLQHP
jgi:cytoskeletal protein RodZ